jgi:hypothetical protein
VPTQLRLINSAWRGEVEFLDHVNIATLGRWSKSVSYVLFFVLPVAVTMYCSSFRDPKLLVPRGPVVAMFAVALLWQLFTVCYHRQFLSWVLVILYGLALAALLWV